MERAFCQALELPLLQVHLYKLNISINQNNHFCDHHYIIEFGYTVLEINPVTVFDHGTYEVIAVNQLGEARQSAVVEVAGHRSDSVNTFLERTQRESSVSVPAAPQKIVDRPNFHSDLRSQELFEGQPIYLESKYSPINDQSLKVTFLLNGNPVQNSKSL
jgi:hypothetical protein